jgi:hypothetical protein
LFLEAALPEPPPPLPSSPALLKGVDHRGQPLDLGMLRGRAVCVLAASRRVHSGAQEVAERMGDAFGGDARVALVLVLDGTDVPTALRGVARSALGTLRAQAMREFRRGFERTGKAIPPDVETLVWLLPDWDGGLFTQLGVSLPLQSAVLLVIDATGAVLGRLSGEPAVMADGAVELVRRSFAAGGPLR